MNRPGADAAELRAALLSMAPAFFAGLRDPWWLIGSAAATLSGVRGIPVHDIDVLCSERDAEALIAARAGEVDAGYRPAGEGRFRSRFARLHSTPLPVEVMGGLQVNRDGRWRPVEVVDGTTVACGERSFPVPTLPEQLRLFELFGRDKDLEKARRLREYLGENADVA